MFSAMAPEPETSSGFGVLLSAVTCRGGLCGTSIREKQS